MGDNYPNEGEIYKGKIVKIESFGAFVDIEGFYANGLVHISQLAKDRVEHPSDVVSIDQSVFVKVLSVEPPDSSRRRPKISLSMKYADQSSGDDRDRNGIELEQEQRRRRSFGSTQSKPVTLEAVYNTVCTKCNGKGHIASECFNIGGTTYELIGDEDYDLYSLGDKDRTGNSSFEQVKAPVGRGRGATLPSWMTDDKAQTMNGEDRGRDRKRKRKEYDDRSRSNSDESRKHKKKKEKYHKKKKDKKKKHKHKSKSSKLEKKTRKDKKKRDHRDRSHSRNKHDRDDSHQQRRSRSWSISSSESRGRSDSSSEYSSYRR